VDSDSVATFSVDSKSGRELRPYLSSITDKCEQNAADLPKVIVIDGLHHISSPLSDAFDGFLSVDYKSRWLSHTEEVTCMLYGCFLAFIADVLCTSYTIWQVVMLCLEHYSS